MDLEQKAMERLKTASEMSLYHYGKPLVCTYSGGFDERIRKYGEINRKERWTKCNSA